MVLRKAEHVTLESREVAWMKGQRPKGSKKGREFRRAPLCGGVSLLGAFVQVAGFHYGKLVKYGNRGVSKEAERAI